MAPNHDSTQAEPRSRAHTWLPAAVILATLAWAIWVSQFLHSAAFGLYQDDYGMMAYAIDVSVGELLTAFGNAFADPIAGRPLHQFFIYLLGFTGYRIGELQGLYWAAFLVETTKAVSFYLIVHHIFKNRTIAFAGALALALFPADTSRLWLTSSYCMQTSLTMVLIAIYMYLLNRNILAYVLVFTSLLTYETPFLIFFAVPLLCDRRSISLGRELVRNAAILSTMLVVFGGFRLAVGEHRLTQLDHLEAARTMLRHMVGGPLSSLAAYARRPLSALPDLSTSEMLLMVATFGILLGAFGLLTWGWLERGPRPRAGVDDRGADVPSGRRLLVLVGAGLAMLVLAYPLTFTGNYRASGIDSRTHIAASVGAALIVTCLVAAVFHMAQTRGRQVALVTVLAAGFATSMAAWFPVQRDYAASWRLQSAFWTDVLRLAPDLDQGTRILIVEDGLPQTRFAPVVRWEAYHTIGHILRFPDTWADPPRVFRIPSDWQQRLVTDDGWFRLDPADYRWAPEDELTFPAAKAIVLEIVDGEMVRRTPAPEPATDAVERPAPPIERGFLYDRLIRG